MNLNLSSLFFNKDNLFILVISISLWYIFSQYDVFEFLYMATREFENFELDECIVLSVMLPILLFIANNKRLALNESRNYSQKHMQLASLLESKSENKILLDSNWVLDSSEAKKLIEKLGKERGTTGFSDEEASILLNWANNIRHNEHILNMIEKNVIGVDIIENKIMLKKKI